MLSFLAGYVVFVEYSVYFTFNDFVHCRAMMVSVAAVSECDFAWTFLLSVLCLFLP